MPSSPGPNLYTRELHRFFYRGISLLPQDALPEGKSAWALNIRSHEYGTFEPRYGQTLLSDNALADPIDSIVRLNDATPFGEIGAPSRRILHAGTAIYGTSPPGPAAVNPIDTGPYSTNPVSFVVTTPAQSPRPFAYVYDSLRQRKINSSFNDMSLGLAQPLTAPTAELAMIQTTYLETVTDPSTNWTAYGGVTTPASPTPAPVVDRVNTTLTQLIYDAGSTGFASVSVADFNNVTAGMSLDIGTPGTETIIVHSVHPPVSPTTIQSILYDSGTAGLCTIQPDTSFSVGQIEAALPIEIERRYRDLATPVPPRVTVTRTVDFPVNSLVLLGGIEVVRILSVAIGRDGIQSFRCSTVNTFAVGNSISGISSFRAYFNTTKSVGDPAVAKALDVTVTPPTTAAVVGGVQAPLGGPTRNWALVGTQATTPQDIIRFGIKVSELGYVTAVRLVLDLSPTGPAFLRDYLFYEWRASDLISAIQATAETATALVADAQADAVTRGIDTALYKDQYGQIQYNSALLNKLAQRPEGFFPTVGPAERARDKLNRDLASAQAETGLVSTGSGIQRQLALGNDAWLTLECRVGDLTRVGTDTTLTLGVMQNAAIYATIEGTTNAIDVQVSDCYLTGGYGPDVGTILPPYVYRYSYRSTITGERSNPSPPMRAGVDPRRGRVVLTATPSLSGQADLIDFWKFGGALARWTYVGTTPSDSNASPFVATFNDDMSDQQIDGGESPRVDLYQPWPTSDLPRSGLVNVAGTSVEWVSGDTFDTSWAPDSLIIINGFATQLYTSPESTTRLQVVDNCGSGTAVPFSLPSPTLLSQPLPYAFGGFVNDVWFTFAVGDPNDPGTLHWSNGNDPDSSADRNSLYVTTADTPLIGGYFDDGLPYVFSTEKLYRIIATFGAPTGDFAVVETACQRGLWSPWAFCKHPDGGVFFLSKDAISYTAGGGPAQSITDPDLRPLFPQEGTEPFAIRNLNPIDFTAITALKLSFVDRLLYFDYLDTEGEYHTLVCDPRVQGWTPDQYSVGITARLGESGPQVETQITGGADGNLRQVDSVALVDVDSAGEPASIQWAYWTPWPNGADPRAYKQWGDAILDFNAGGCVDGVQVTPVVDNGNVALTPQLVGAGDTLRTTYLIEVGTGGGLGYGVLSRNFGMWIQGACQVCDTNRPIFYLWEPAFLPKGTSVARRATDWEDLGYRGAKFIQGIVIRANTFGEIKELQAQYDGVNAAPLIGVTFDINHNGEQAIAYPRAAAGWNPFVGELVRLQGQDDIEWTLLDWRWVWEPAPELASQWETQYTTFNYPGFLDVHDGIVAYQSTAPVTWFVEYQDGFNASYVLPATANLYFRTRQICVAQKGKAVRFRWTSDEPFRLFKNDCSVRVQAWGAPGGYQIQTPFGGPSRVDGAGI